MPKAGRKPKRREVTRADAWRDLATRTGGSLVGGNRWSGDRVRVPHGPWTVWLDTYVVSNGSTAVTYTRAQAHVLGWRGLTVTVRRRSFLDRAWEALGFGRRLPVSPLLTELCMVKGKPESRVPSLFSAPGLTEALLRDPSLRLEIKRPPRKVRRRLGKEAAEVTCRATGVITDVDRLEGMIRMVCESLDALHRVGEASEQEVKLGDPDSGRGAVP
jgi:hypothetical protein